MCTAAIYQSKNHYFGRNLDYEFSYGENAVIIPRNFPFNFREVGTMNSHYAIIGITYLAPDPTKAATTKAPDPTKTTTAGTPENYPLLYDAINEKGLGVAGLNFVGNTVYHDHVDDKDNIAQFELLPWLLGQCASVTEAKTLLTRINLRSFPFRNDLPAAELHWMISDLTGACIVVESVADGLKIHDNPAGVLTNNPPFNEQFFALNNYMHLSAASPENKFAPNLPLTEYSRGMGAIGLPGDLSSQSRFVKAAFTRANSLTLPEKTAGEKTTDEQPPIAQSTTAQAPTATPKDDLNGVSQFFHILHSVDQQYGCCNLGDGKYEYTIYSSGYDLEHGIFYYTTYANHQISALNLHSENLDSDQLIVYPILETEQIHHQN
jgi:choloylglycine hydrolase